MFKKRNGRVLSRPYINLILSWLDFFFFNRKREILRKQLGDGDEHNNLPKPSRLGSI